MLVVRSTPPPSSYHFPFHWSNRSIHTTEGEIDGSGIEVIPSMKGGIQDEVAVAVTRLLMLERVTCMDAVCLWSM